MTDVAPYSRTWIVNRQQQLGLGRDVLQVAHERRAILTIRQVGVVHQICPRIEKFGELLLKPAALRWSDCLSWCHASALPSASSRNKLRSRMRALCN